MLSVVVPQAEAMHCIKYKMLFCINFIYFYLEKSAVALHECGTDIYRSAYPLYPDTAVLGKLNKNKLLKNSTNLIKLFLVSSTF
jgi:hypothetical protein